MERRRNSGPTGARSRRSPTAALAALGFGLGIAGLLLVGGGEIVARVSGARPHEAVPNPHPWAEKHPVLGWVNRAGRVPSHEAGHAPMTFWAGGRRASRPDPAVGDAATRVWLVGGSFTQGYGVPDDQTFAWLLDAGLPELAVENYGTGGYGTYQSLLLLEQLFATQAVAPDLVIYGFVSFHAARNVQTYQWLEALRDNAGRRFASPYVALRDGVLYRQPSASIQNWPLEQRSALVHALHAGWYRWALRDRDAQSLPATLALLGEMDALVRRSGARLLVAALFDGGEPPIFEGTALAALAGGESSVNCTHPKGLYRSPELRVGGTGHPNHRVHAYWADCIGSWLDAHLPGLAPRESAPRSRRQGSSARSIR